MYLLLKPNELNYFNLAKSQLHINDDFGHVRATICPDLSDRDALARFVVAPLRNRHES